jgi:hypothetical protein
MTSRALSICIGLATGALALGCGTGGLWAQTALVLATGGLWLLGQWRRWRWTPSVALVLLVSAAADGILEGMPAGWMLCGTVAALAAWDLDHYALRRDGVARVDRARESEVGHLRRLSIVSGLGLLLAAAGLLVRVRLGFGVALLLGALVVLGLGQSVGFLKRESD